MQRSVLAGAFVVASLASGGASAVTLTNLGGSLPEALLETPVAGQLLDGFTIRFLSEIETLDVGLSNSFVNRILRDEFPEGTGVEVEIDLSVNDDVGAFVTFTIDTGTQRLTDFVAASYDPMGLALDLDVTDELSGIGAGVRAFPCSAVTSTGALFDLVAAVEAGCAEFTGGSFLHNNNLNRFLTLTAASGLEVDVRLAAVPIPATGAMLLTALGAGAFLRRRP